MTRAALRVGWYRLRCTVRRRWPAFLVVALFVGLLGGLAMASVAGARRTQSAFTSYLQSSHTSDLQLVYYTGQGQNLNDDLYSPALARRLASLPQVRRVSATVQVLATEVGKNGRPYLPAPMSESVVETEGSVNGYGFAQDTVVADQGRLADPRRADEMMATADAARLLHWHVGQVVSLDVFSIQQLYAANFSAPALAGPPVVRVRADLVGIVSSATSVVEDQVDRYPTAVLFTPALTSRIAAGDGALFPTYDLELRHGAADVPAVERELIGALPANSTYNFHVSSVVAGEVNRAVKPESIALGIFGLIATMATLFIAAQAVSRAIRSEARDLDVMRALGADPAMTVTDSLLGMVIAVVSGALIACGLCVALSPIAPIGAVRQIDPAPGFATDWTVLISGFAVLVVVLSAVAVAVAAATIRHRNIRQVTSLREENSTLVGLAVRLGLPPASVAGVRFAVERGRGRNAVPVGSALMGSALAVGVVVTTLTFGSSLNTLISSPHLYGWNWDDAIAETGGGPVPPGAIGMVQRDRYIATWSGIDFADAQIDGVTVPILLQAPGAHVSPPILAGHEVDANNQIVLGGSTLAALHKHVGDTVVVSYGSPANAPIYVPPTTLRIVGKATLPALGDPGVLHTSMGTGAVISQGIESPAMQAALLSPDPNQNGPSTVVVRLRPDAAAAGLASLQRIAAAATKLALADPSSSGSPFAVLPVQQPAEIVNYRAMGDTPAVLAGALATGATLALGLILVASVNRRRRDLALLRALGFVRRQLGAVIAWQASISAVVGLVVGVPLGILVGRVLWNLFASEIVAVPRSTVPAVQIVLVAVGAVILANLVALIPGRIAGHTRTAELLRIE